MEAKQQEKPAKKIHESSRMVIYLLNGTTENCTVNQWDESTKDTYVITKNDTQILIPHHAVLKIMFEMK